MIFILGVRQVGLSFILALRFPPSARSGQALVEFALTSVLLALLLLGAVEFGLLFADELQLEGAVRIGAGWAEGHPSAWSSASAPPSNTIQGQVLSSAAGLGLTNDDTDLGVLYYRPGNPNPVLCGRYSASAGQFVPASGSTQTSCLAAGGLVKISVSDPTALISPLFRSQFGPTVNLQAAAAMPLTP